MTQELPKYRLNNCLNRCTCQKSITDTLDTVEIAKNWLVPTNNAKGILENLSWGLRMERVKYSPPPPLQVSKCSAALAWVSGLPKLILRLPPPLINKINSFDSTYYLRKGDSIAWSRCSDGRERRGVKNGTRNDRKTLFFFFTFASYMYSPNTRKSCLETNPLYRLLAWVPLKRFTNRERKSVQQYSVSTMTIKGEFKIQKLKDGVIVTSIANLANLTLLKLFKVEFRFFLN